MIAEALLEGTQVFVRDDEGARALWRMGWFGKGTVSRGRPRCAAAGDDDEKTAASSSSSHRPARTRGRRPKKIAATSKEKEGRELAARIEADERALAEVSERVQLSHCEAFYLAFVVRCCRVALPPDSSSSPSETLCWRLFCAEDARFPELFAAYTHYRRMGWAPRSGLPHGVDFLLYRPGARHSHAPFSVIVAGCSSQPSWARVCHSSRNMVSVAKRLLLCEVSFARPEDRESPQSCVDSASSLCCDVALSRWVPEQDRK